MSILINGITLDDFIQYGGEYAAYLDGTGYIVELPDHGDLIDRNAMAEDLAYDVEMDNKALNDTDIVGIERKRLLFDKACKQNCIYYLTEQKAIIPAERSKE